MITTAMTKRRWMKPPKVKAVSTPKSHKTIKMTAIVHNIYVFLKLVNYDLNNGR